MDAYSDIISSLTMNSRCPSKTISPALLTNCPPLPWNLALKAELTTTVIMAESTSRAHGSLTPNRSVTTATAVAFEQVNITPTILRFLPVRLDT